MMLARAAHGKPHGLLKCRVTSVRVGELAGRGLRLPASRRPTVAVRASVRARWCIDVEYGHKQTATGMLQEWVSEVGAKAGLTHTNTRLSSGSVGVAESRLELEVTFSSLSEWEHFLAAIPVKDHRAWSQRVQSMIVGGSPRWELYRAVPAFPDGQEAPVVAAPVARPLLAMTPYKSGTTSSGSGRSSPAAASADEQPPASNSGGLTIIDDPQAAEVVLDWKGDPLKINPGDKLPFKFL